MAVTTYTISGDVGDLIGGDLAYYGTSEFRPTAITAVVESNIPDDGVSVLVAGGQIRLADYRIPVEADGTFSQDSFVASDSDDTNIDPETPLQYRLRLDYPRASDNTRKTWHSPWFELTEATDVSTVVEVAFLPASFVSEAITAVEDARDDALADVAASTAAAEAAQAAAEAARDDAIDICNIAVDDDIVEALINTVAGPKTQAALSASIAEQAPVTLAASSAMASRTPHRVRSRHCRRTGRWSGAPTPTGFLQGLDQRSEHHCQRPHRRTRSHLRQGALRERVLH